MKHYDLECAVWELTLKCNLSCMHCGASAGQPREAELSEKEALELCEGLKAAGAKGVALMGGEPTLRRDWHEIAQKLRSLGINISLITNGFVWDDALISKLLKLEPKAVAISIDAADPELHDHIRGRQGSFNSAWGFARACRDAGLPVSVITTVHRRNIAQLPALRDLLLDQKMAWQVQTAGGEGKRFSETDLLTAEEFYSVGMFVGAQKKTYPPARLPLIGAHDLGHHSCLIPSLGLAKWNGCQAGITVLGIRSDGKIKGCLAVNDGTFEGNVRKTPLTEIWNADGAFPYNRNFNKNMLGPNCSSCAYGASCRGGCGEMSLMLTGKRHNNPYCFNTIEKELLAGEMKNPLKKMLFSIRRKMNESPVGGETLSGIFSGIKR